MNTPEIHQKSLIQQTFDDHKSLELAILIGSQADNTATPNSDWDFAIQWKHDIDPIQQLVKTEKLRNQLAKALHQPDNKIDLINIPTAGLAIRGTIANNGIILRGENTLALSHFLLKTWRDLEEFYWDKLYAA